MKAAADELCLRLQRLRDRNGIAIEIFAESARERAYRLAGGVLEREPEEAREGFAITVDHCGKTSGLGANGLSTAHVQGGLAAVSARAGVQALGSSRLVGLLQRVLTEWRSDLVGFSPGWERTCADLLLSTEGAAGAALSGFKADYSGSLRSFLTLGPYGWHRSSPQEHHLLECRAMAGPANGYRRAGTRDRSRWTRWADQAVAHAAEAGRVARAKRDAPAVRERRMAVVAASGSSGALAHELLGHPLESDVASSGAAGVKWTAGDQICPLPLNVLDDPFVPDGWGSYTHDDTGHPAFRRRVVQDGVVTCHIDGAGSRRRQSFRWQPIPRMSNLCVEAGPDRADSLLAGAGEGLYLVRLGAGKVSDDGRFAVGVAEAYRIRNGALAEQVADCVVEGRVAETISHIEGIGNDPAMGSPAACGKFGQDIPVGDGGPTLLITGLTVRPGSL
ncbi:TldD/PmbA family protein [Streptosporangium sp. NPDC023615]|uniref:TldD/PmbA family protein n=1 Tax=Streptosporangium sp. NPDC023615 TaxID=3154794 RepID=UPI00344498FD